MAREFVQGLETSEAKVGAVQVLQEHGVLKRSEGTALLRRTVGGPLPTPPVSAKPGPV